MKINRWLTVAGLAGVLCLGTTQVFAQQDTPPGGPPGQGRGGRGGNFDPAQFRERMMQNLREQLEVTDDAEWKVIEPRVEKVMEVRRTSMSGMGRGMFGRRRGGDNAGGGDQQRRGPFGGEPMPEAEALQKAIDAKASKAELKAAMDKFVAARKAKQSELEKAQDDLRKVLTSRQEAIATLDGLL